MKPMELLNNHSQRISTTKTANGETIALRIGDTMLYGCLAADGREPEWRVLDSMPLTEIRIALHARDGRIVAVGRKLDGTLVHRWFMPEDMLPWKWETLDGKTDLPMQLVERHTGGIEAFLIDEQGVLFHRWTNREFKWADAWASLENDPAVSAVVENNVEGFPQAYILLADHKGIAVRRHLNDGTWNAWNYLGFEDAETFTAETDENGWIVLIARDTDGKARICRQTAIDSYSDWQ